MIIRRKWAMPSKTTFAIPVIRDVVDRHFPVGETADPFANSCRIAKYCNDIDPAMECDSCMEALDFLKGFADSSLDGLLFDPPYSPYQSKRLYTEVEGSVNLKTTSKSYWSKLKKEIARIVKTNGCVISAGWNSGGIGLRYGFEVIEILLCPHGGGRNDTIVVVERKATLF